MQQKAFHFCLGLSIIINTIKGVSSFPDRVPVYEYPEICASMDPFGHNTTAMNDATPYRIIFNTNGCYSNSNQKIYVTVYHHEEGGIFEGMFLEARKVGDTKDSWGVFDNNGDSRFTAYSCGGSLNNTYGHSAHARFNQTVLTWAPTPDLTSDIYFIATMVRRTSQYWMDVRSAVLRYNEACTEFAVTNPSLMPVTTTPTSQTTAGSGAQILSNYLVTIISTLVPIRLLLNYLKL